MNSLENVGAIRRRVSLASPPPWAAFWEGRDHRAGSNFIMRGAGDERGEDIEIVSATLEDYDFIAFPTAAPSQTTTSSSTSDKTSHSCWTKSTGCSSSFASNRGSRVPVWPGTCPTTSDELCERSEVLRRSRRSVRISNQMERARAARRTVHTRRTLGGIRCDIEFGLRGQV
jgi:hypothetical protein